MAGFTRSTLLGLFAHATVIVAFPGSVLQGRSSCNHDNCLRAVIASNAKPYSASASADCVSFFQQTVTPCASDASTVFVTSTATQTVATPTSTALVTFPLTVSTETLAITVPYITTDTTQNVSVIVSTVNIQPTVFSTFTTTTTETAIVTITSAKTLYAFSPSPTPTAVQVPRKEKIEAEVLKPRLASQCPVTLIPSAVPTYASACSGTARYSSACACIGVTQKTQTTTLPVVTSTATTTAYITPDAVTSTSTIFTPVTATATEIVSLAVDATATEDLPVTATATLPAVTVIGTSTTTTTTTATSTYFVPVPTQYCQMALRASGGVVDGRYMFAGMQNPALGVGLIVISPAGSTSISTFQLDSTGALHVLDTIQSGREVYQSGTYATIYAPTEDYYVNYGAGNSYHPFVCQIDNSTLEVNCQSYSSATPFIWFNGPTTTLGPYLERATSVGTTGGKAFTMFAEPVQCTT